MDAMMVKYRWDVMYAESREQRIDRYHREGAVRLRKDGEMDMRYAACRFIANPKAGTIHPA